MTTKEQGTKGTSEAGGAREPYAKPSLVKHDNLKAITFECPGWQCSVVEPPPGP